MIGFGAHGLCRWLLGSSAWPPVGAKVRATTR